METTQNGLQVHQEESTPNALIKLAIDKNVDIDKLEKLMQMQERWQANEAHKQFLEAMSKFQNECPPLMKSKKVAFGNTKYNYAPLGEIFATIKDKLRQCGLSYRWEMNDENGSILCTCIISHTSGHSEKTTMSANKDSSGGKNEIQQRGSTITYLQRYTLIGALGISTADEDNDGQTHESVKAPDIREAVPQNKPAPQRESIPISKGEDERPWLNEKQLRQAIDKINAGDLGIYEKTIGTFKMKREYRKQLDEVYEFSKSLIR